MAQDTSALALLLDGDPALFAIVRLSLLVSLSATTVAALLGIPLGALVALTRFPGRQAVIIFLNAMMGLPPVVVGLMVYLLLSRSGPLGSLGLLFTPLAMIAVQSVLVLPIIAALARQTIEDLWVEYRDELAALGVGPTRRIATLIWDGRFSLLTALLATLGETYSIAAPVIATQARVALGDHIGERMGVRTLIVVIGERPGLSVADSLGIYLTHRPRPGCTDADRNCISNIHPPDGLGYADAARITAGLVAGARRLGRSGVDLKDTSRADELASRPTLILE